MALKYKDLQTPDDKNVADTQYLALIQVHQNNTVVPVTTQNVALKPPTGVVPILAEHGNWPLFLDGIRNNCA